jgi:predicted P-loop ATPase
MMDLEYTNDGFFDVLSQLALDGNNKVLKTIDNFVTIFQNDIKLKNCIAYNELFCSAENLITGKRWEDADDSIVMSYIEKKYKIRHTESYYNAFNIVCYQNAYNPIKDIINNLEWDNKPRIKSIFQKYLKCEDSEYVREVAKLTFLGGIARLYSPGIKYDNMPIFIGKQGCGKSTFVRWLAIKDCFFKEISEIDGQKGIEALEGAWICEMSELLALTKSKEVEAVKSFITRQNDSYRKPYERRLTDNPRKCIIIGSTNRSQFLTDKTGNRRFFPINVNSNGYDIAAQETEIRAEILQCWAEAKYIYDSGNFSLLANEKLLDTFKSKQSEVVEDDWRIGVIEKYIKDKSSVCVKDIWDNALSGEHPKDCTKKDSSDIVQIMDAFCDWEKVSCIRFDTYGRQRGWRKKLKEVVDTDLPFQTEINEGDMPY